MKDKILKYFYIDNLSQKDIATKLNISKGYVSRIVTNDIRYQDFKKEKLNKNKIKHNNQIQEYTKRKRKEMQFSYAVDDLVLKKLHNQASTELSRSSYLSNENYRKWNISAYHYNPLKKRYEFDSKLGRASDIPKYIKER